MVGALMTLYSLAVLLVSFALWRWGERHWLLIGLCYAPPVLYLIPLLPLLAAAAVLKMRAMALPLLVLTAYIVAGPMDFRFPRPGGGEGALTILSYNVRAGLGADGKGAGPALADFLHASGADLIGLQECRQPVDTRFSDPTPDIVERMSGFYSVRGGHRGELLALSRFPIVSSQEHDLDGYSPLQEIVVEVNGHKVRFLNIHVLTGDPKRVLKGKAASRTDYLRVSAQSRHDQTRVLLRVLRQSDLPHDPGGRLQLSTGEPHASRAGRADAGQLAAQRPGLRPDLSLGLPPLEDRLSLGFSAISSRGLPGAAPASVRPQAAEGSLLASASGVALGPAFLTCL